MGNPLLGRLAVWTPLPPQPGDVARENAVLLAALARHVDVVAVTDDWVAPLAEAPPGCVVLGASDFVALGEPADVSEYHLDNDFEQYAFAHAGAERTPGVVVLHDAHLDGFYRDAYFRTPEQFQAECWRNHGRGGERAAARPLLLRRVLESCRGAIVDMPGLAQELRRRFPAVPCDAIPRPYLRPTPEPPALRDALGWTDDDLVIGSLGPLCPPARPELSVAVAAACQDVDSRVRLLVGGSARDPVTVRRLDAAVRALHRRGAALITDPSPAEWDACVEACDVLIDLQGDDLGSVSGALVQALAAGIPVITCDFPRTAHLPSSACWRVGTDDRTAVRETVGRVLRLLAGEDRGAVRDAARDAAAAHDVDLVARAHVDAAQRAVERPRIRMPRTVALERPLNLYGDFVAMSGLMEAGRQLTRALLGAPLDLRIVDITSHGPTHSAARGEPELVAVRRDRAPDGNNLWFANINEFPDVTDEQLRPPGSGGRVIALWFWELPRLSDWLLHHVNRVDEIWVASTFVRDTMRRHTSRPVHVIPIPVEPRLPAAWSRRDYDLPEGRPIYFFNFDANSTVARKNPFGVIEAFRRAFRPDERGDDALLVIKCQHLSNYPKFEPTFTDAMREVRGVVIRDDLSASEMAGLLAAVDVYVSLHRSEGFGLGMAEAMALGKPVVATAYSGCTDFLQQRVSCPVGYDVRPITDLDHEWWPEGAVIYPPGLTYWAEPDIDGAARWMRLLFERPELRERIGQAAAAAIAERYSAARARATVLELLAEPARAAA